MYDKSTGDTLLVGFDGAGKINLRRADGGWRTSWDLITVGPFIGNGCDQVLLYDRAGRHGGYRRLRCRWQCPSRHIEHGLELELGLDGSWPFS